MTLYYVHAAEDRRRFWEDERETPYEPNENIVDPEGNARHVITLAGSHATAAIGEYNPDG